MAHQPFKKVTTVQSQAIVCTCANKFENFRPVCFSEPGQLENIAFQLLKYFSICSTFNTELLEISDPASARFFKFKNHQYAQQYARKVYF